MCSRSAPPGGRYSEPGSIGHPEEGVEALIVGYNGLDAPVDGVGELWLRTPTSMLGYYRDEAATEAALRPAGWIATGDLARRLPSGELAIVGRPKEMIIRFGFNVYPAEVEAALSSLTGIAASGVVGRRMPDCDEQVIGVPVVTWIPRLLIGHSSSLLRPTSGRSRLLRWNACRRGQRGKSGKQDFPRWQWTWLPGGCEAAQMPKHFLVVDNAAGGGVDARNDPLCRRLELFDVGASGRMRFELHAFTPRNDVKMHMWH